MYVCQFLTQKCYPFKIAMLEFELKKFGKQAMGRILKFPKKYFR